MISDDDVSSLQGVTSSNLNDRANTDSSRSPGRDFMTNSGLSSENWDRLGHLQGEVVLERWIMTSSIERKSEVWHL